MLWLTAPHEDWRRIQGFLCRRFARQERERQPDGPSMQLDGRLVSRWNEGASVGELCEELDRSERGILARLEKHGLLGNGFANLRKS